MGKSVLDVGCGIGYGTNLISSIADEAEGIDISEEAISECKLNYYNKFTVSSIEEYEPDELFDVVTCFEVIEHISSMDAGINAIKRITKPRGMVLMSMPIFQGRNPFHHNRHYSCDDWKRFIDDNFCEYWDTEYFHQPLVNDGSTGVNITPLLQKKPKTGILLSKIQRL